MKVTTYIQALNDASRKQSFIDPQKAYDLAEQARTLALTHHLRKEEGYALFHMAYACRVKSDYANGLTLSFKALDIFEAIGDQTGLYRVRNIIGIIYFYYGAYSDALEQFSKGLELLESLYDPNVKSSILNNIGEIYREAGEYEKARSYYDQALDIAVAEHFEFNKAAIWLNMGEISYQMGQFESSKHYVEMAYEIVLRENHILEQGESESKLGRVMIALGDYTRAKHYLNTASEKFEKMHNKYYLVELLIEMANLDEASKQSPIKHLEEALDIAIVSGLGKKEGEIYHRFANYYEKQGTFDKALEAFKKYHHKMTEIETLNLSKRLEILSVEFEYYKEKSEQNQFELLTEKLSREVMSTKHELEQIKENNHQLFHKSMMDELTHVYNRHGIDHQLKIWFSESRCVSGAVFLIDIDQFKKYNDLWGHVRGDHCLVQVAAALNELHFEDYFVGRYGGDEFIAFAKVDTYEAAQILGETIHSCVNLIGDMDQVTLSVGGYYGDLSYEKITEVIDRADTQLYAAKDEGRNQFKVTRV